MATDARHPLEILPPEIWEIILEKLKKTKGSSRDLLNCSKVCTEFQKILEPTKQEWLFESICPFILPYLKGGELLACRRICKNWRRGVDNVLEDFETRRPFNERNDISRSTRYDLLHFKGIKWTAIRDEFVLDEILEARQNQEMQPTFVGRSLSLEGERGETWRNFFEKALEMLILYGDHISHFRVQPKQSDFSFNLRDFYQILCYTPKLKCLSVTCRRFDHDGRPNLLEDLPQLEIISLETLEIDFCACSPVLILESLFSKINFRNLKCLKLHNNTIFNIIQCTVGPLQHLTELHLTAVNLSEVEHLLNTLISPTAPLAKLSLEVRCFMFNTSQGINLDGVCIEISKWKETLRVLVINLKLRIDLPPKMSLSKLDTPNLRRLEMKGMLFGTGFLPATVTPSLEYLRICYLIRNPHESVVDPRLDFYKSVFVAGDPYNSSIWNEIPKLKLVRVERPGEYAFLTRRIYEEAKLVKRRRLILLVVTTVVVMLLW